MNDKELAEMRERIEDVLIEFSHDMLTYGEAVDRLFEIFKVEQGRE